LKIFQGSNSSVKDEEDEQGEVDIGDEEEDEDDEEGDEYEDEDDDGPGTKALVGPIIDDDDEEDYDPNAEVGSSPGLVCFSSLSSPYGFRLSFKNQRLVTTMRKKKIMGTKV